MLLIGKSRCVGCSVCVSNCPTGAITVDMDEGIAVLEYDKCTECLICVENCSQDAIKDISEELVFAIGTDDGVTIKQDDHFGMSGIFKIYRYSDGELVFQEERENAKYREDETRILGDPDKARATASALGGVDVLVGKVMGPNIVRLKERFVPIIVRQPEIHEALDILKGHIIEISDEKEKTERKGLILK